MRAYFDVRGPGVLVDPSQANGQPLVVAVTPKAANPVGFTIMNTGEGTDTFNFTITGLPAGWSASTDIRTLNAGQGAIANVQVSVPANATEQDYTIAAYGQSTTTPTIVTTSTFTLRVTLH